MNQVQENPNLPQIAAKYLSISLSEAETNRRELPNLGAVYFWQAGRGGNSIIVGADSSFLFANSSVPFDTHLASFREGRRTDPALFDTV